MSDQPALAERWQLACSGSNSMSRDACWRGHSCEIAILDEVTPSMSSTLTKMSHNGASCS